MRKTELLRAGAFDSYERKKKTMLTKRQNLMETIRGGNPDRFVNQYEPFAISFATPYTAKYPQPTYGGEPTVDGWGVTKSWPVGTPGSFPIHDAEHIVCKDIENWRDYVKAPSLDFTDEDWDIISNYMED